MASGLNMDKIVSPLTVNPPAIQFDDIKPGVLHVITFSIRNNTSRATRIRIQPPKKTYFSCNFVPSTAIAPGLDIKVEVGCILPENMTNFLHEMEDYLVVITEKYQVKVPILASKPISNIDFNSLLDLGFAIENSSVKKALLIKNDGNAEALVSFLPSSLFTATPSSLSVEGAGGVAEVIISFSATGAGLGIARDVLQAAKRSTLYSNT